MNASEALHIPPLKGRVIPQERQTRVDLAACYRLVANFRWRDRALTHIPARVPGQHDQFLINPCGMMFDEGSASSRIKIDLRGNKLEESPFPVNPAGFTIHPAIRSRSTRHGMMPTAHSTRMAWPGLLCRLDRIDPSYRD